MTMNERAIRTGVAIIATVGCALAALLTLADIHTPIRSGLTLAALVLGTGWAVTCWVELKEIAFAATVAIATVLSILCFYALFFVEIGWWHPVGSIGALLIAAAAANAIAVVWQLLRGDRA